MKNVHKKSFLQTLSTSVRNGLVSGLLVIVPFAVTIVIITWLFRTLAKLIEPVVTKVLEMGQHVHLIQQWDDTYVRYAVSLATILCLLFLIYAIGSIVKFVAGKRLFAIGEQLVMQIPLASTIYSATKQVTTALALPENTAFKSVVLVEFPRQGAFALGFLTGTIPNAKTGTLLAKVFIPTTPNPTTGFFEMIPAQEVMITAITVEEAFKMIISGGILSPDQLEISGTAASGYQPKSAEVDLTQV